MSEIVTARMTADAPAGTAVFLIGMRINALREVRSWLPVVRAMPKMLAELRQRPDLGLLGSHLFRSGRTLLLLQYWRDVEALDRYARGADTAHLPAWREFNRRVRGNGHVGIYHETYVIDRYETIYANMPADFGLGGATALVPAGRLGQRAAHRLDPSVADEPVVAPW